MRNCWVSGQHLNSQYFFFFNLQRINSRPRRSNDEMFWFLFHAAWIKTPSMLHLRGLFFQLWIFLFSNKKKYSRWPQSTLHIRHFVTRLWTFSLNLTRMNHRFYRRMQRGIRNDANLQNSLTSQWRVINIGRLHSTVLWTLLYGVMVKKIVTDTAD